MLVVCVYVCEWVGWCAVKGLACSIIERFSGGIAPNSRGEIPSSSDTQHDRNMIQPATPVKDSQKTSPNSITKPTSRGNTQTHPPVIQSNAPKRNQAFSIPKFISRNLPHSSRVSCPKDRLRLVPEPPEIATVDQHGGRPGHELRDGDGHLPNPRAEVLVHLPVDCLAVYAAVPVAVAAGTHLHVVGAAADFAGTGAEGFWHCCCCCCLRRRWVGGFV